MSELKVGNSASAKDHHSEQVHTGSEPIIVDMGKGSRKNVRKLRKGKPGKLLRRVQETLEHLRENGALSENAQPIVIVVRERRSTKMFGLG